MQRKDWAARVDGLVVFRGLLQSEPLASLRAALAADAAGLTGAMAAFESALFTQGTNWTEVLLDAVLEDENLCLRTAAGGDAGPVLEKALENELEFLQQLGTAGLDDLCPEAPAPDRTELVIGTGVHEQYTPEYRALTRDFYLKF